ncbi:hypothetical protein SADUNF_Sadunf17G0131600 [Salix dunnii]|uniref:R13L1/DRL21-like LRR repeat region domain-containing protein n=1 Tax=Salix dunnii TaxID=1413687 RepID=A0A835J446_9ROSI|nr:hypothetical protein SADUNF_Sadunf17G0131600 [Salix dunnii]
MKLRYYGFPSNLKQCFVYCPLFPKDHSFQREKTVLLWLANGFLGGDRGEKEEGYGLGDSDSRISHKTRHIWCPTIRGYEDLKNLVGDGFHIFHTILPTSNESFWGDVNDEKLKAFNSLRVLPLSNINRIDELGELRYLLGDLRILNLQNVSHGLNAIEARLKGKNLKKLELRWSGKSNSGDSLAEEDVLKTLRPGAKVEDISIIGYGGKKLPGWVGDTSFENLVYLRLSGCKYCVSLPSLGQLESLRTLLIEGFYNLESVGDELYGSPTTKRNPFQSLESLTFERMLQWREWESKGRAFSSLQVLCIRKCPSLTTLPSDLPSLVELEIAKCKLVGLPSGWSPATINKIMLANDFHKVQLEKLSSDSQSLTVDSFHAFDFIRQEIENWGYACTTLQKNDITRCPLKCRKLKSLCGPEEPLGDSMSTKSFCSGCPTLETLALSNCSKFESLFCSLPALKYLNIVACGKLQSLLGMDFSASLEPLTGNSSSNSEACEYPNLKILSLEHCSNFESLFCSLPSLENLKIVACGKLQSLHGMGFSASLEPLTGNSSSNSEVCEYPKLKILSLEHCSKFESLFCSLPSLENLKIVACGKLQSLHGMGFSASLEPLTGNSSSNSEVCEYPNLKFLSLEHCSNLKTVHCLLPSLEHLELYNCGHLEPFLGMGFSSSSGLRCPSKLKSIVILGCRKLLAGCDKWGMGRFPSLSTLSLDYSDEVESPLKQRAFLPTLFTFLLIRDLPNLKSLELQGLTSLYGLELEDCPMLQSLSEVSLPSDLFSLYIRSCPLLEQRCQQDIGEDWPKISNVPNILIGYHDFNVKSRKV